MQKFIKYKNCNIGFSDIGKGSAVVLLHGFLENSTMWNSIIPEFSKRNRIVCIDLLGHGTSDCLGYVHTMEEMAEVVKTVIKHLKIRRVTFIGHSMGGYVALAFAEKYIKNVKGICLLNATSKADNDERKKLRLRAIKMAQTNYKSLVSMSINNLFATTSYSQFLEEIEQCKKVALQTSVQSYIACTEGMRLRPNREHILALNSFKKLIIVGKQDAILNYDKIKKEAQRTNTPITTFLNGHMSYIENKSELFIALKLFLRA